MTGGSRPSCVAIFGDEALRGAELQDLVFTHYPGGECETISVSHYSSGPVADAEVLTRLIVHPIHYDLDRGTVSPMAFQDATTIDLSVFREAAATDGEIQLSIDEIRALGQTKVPPQDRLISLVMQATAGELRSAKHHSSGEWLFKIYDTAASNKPAHASVFTPTSARKGSVQRQARKELLRIFSCCQLSPEDYRPLRF